MLSLAYLRHAFSRLRTQDVQQSVCQLWSLQNRIHQRQAAARIIMFGQVQQRPADQPVAAESLRSLYQPQDQLVLVAADVGEQLGVEAQGIVHQVSGVDFEE